ncbi:hypothetical protein ACFLZJ_01695 [Nanoarchaeota archaeon]
MKIRIKHSTISAISLILIVVLVAALIFSGRGHTMDMNEKREQFILDKQEIQGELLSQGNYACCLDKPCTYCIEKTPKHGEGAECHCLDDVVNGVHPCGECIGEIMEGHGNPYLKPYFAEAIAEEVGEEYLSTIEQIIEDKYPALN